MEASFKFTTVIECGYAIIKSKYIPNVSIFGFINPLVFLIAEKQIRQKCSSIQLMRLPVTCYNLFLYFFKSKHFQHFIVKRSIRTYKYHTISRFIGDLYATNDDEKISKSFRCSCSKIK